MGRARRRECHGKVTHAGLRGGVMRALRFVSLAVLGFAATLISPPALLEADPSWSLWSPSPSASTLTPGAILDPATGAPTAGGPQGTPVVAISAAALGLPAGADVDGLSYGDDFPFWDVALPVFYEFAVLGEGAPWLSTAPGAQNVRTQMLESGGTASSGDIFRSSGVLYPTGPDCTLGANVNVQLYDADGANVDPPLAPPALGGMIDPPGLPVGGFYDHIDAYEERDASAVDYLLPPPLLLLGSDGLPDGPIFFTVSDVTAPSLPADPGGTGAITAGDVLVTDASSPTGWVVYADAAALGLAAGDDISALLVSDSIMGPAGVATPARSFGHPTDFIAFSLTWDSPSLAPASTLPSVCAVGAKYAGDMWAVSSFYLGGGPVAWLAAEDLGLCSPRVGAGCPSTAFGADRLSAIDISSAPGGDVDNDGIFDLIEGSSLCPSSSSATNDTDGDGLPDGIEASMGTTTAGACIAGSGYPHPGTWDSDGDGINDGGEIAYWLRFCPTANPSVPDIFNDLDAAASGFPGPDGVSNILEILQGTSPCDADTDGDGFEDLARTAHTGYGSPPAPGMANDNCVTTTNPYQSNSDGNYVSHAPVSGTIDRTWPSSDADGDACEEDDDNDGLADWMESPGPPCASATAATSPVLADTDGDRVHDGAECALGTDPTNGTVKPAPAACGTTVDSDGDRLTARVEYCGYNTSESTTDTDGDMALDGARDGCEAASLNADRVVNSGDQLLLASEIARTPPPAKLASMDINKDGGVNAGDQLVMGSLIAPTGQCP
jgi:hypothetical protein